MNTAGLDRTILKAFYTQYVAVLLIILVFFTAAFQRAYIVSEDDGVQRSVIAHQGSIMNPREINAFSETGAVLSEAPDLIAIAEVLRHHDLRAEFVVFVSQHNFDVAQGNLHYALHRVRALGDFFRQQNVPEQAIGVFVEESPVVSPRVVHLRMKSEGARHGHP